MTNENMILVEYDPFNMESRVCIIQDGNRQYSHVDSELESLVANLVTLAYEKQIFEIKTHAPVAISNEIRKQVTELESATYCINKLNVEGI